jgi:hypothetical protein
MAKGKSSKASKLVQECLATLNVSNENFAGCSNLEEEWKVIKKGTRDVFVSLDRSYIFLIVLPTLLMFLLSCFVFSCSILCKDFGVTSRQRW